MTSETVRRRGFLLASLAVVATGAVAALAVVSDSPPGGASQIPGSITEPLDCLAPDLGSQGVYDYAPDLPGVEPAPQSPEQALQAHVEYFNRSTIVKYRRLGELAPEDFEARARNATTTDFAHTADDGRVFLVVRVSEERPGLWRVVGEARCGSG